VLVFCTKGQVSFIQIWNSHPCNEAFIQPGWGYMSSLNHAHKNTWKIPVYNGHNIKEILGYSLFMLVGYLYRWTGAQVAAWKPDCNLVLVIISGFILFSEIFELGALNCKCAWNLDILKSFWLKYTFYGVVWGPFLLWGRDIIWPSVAWIFNTWMKWKVVWKEFG
jgi:hypothetical protein